MKMESCDIKVSICCLTYNHEKYVRQALEGFLMQKTNFKYEILIHDDASTDGTADIIREYEKRYPNIIKPIYQTENQYSQRVKINWLYQFPRAKGKYIALCEGDDFWCDDNKLQSQYDALESSGAIFCTHGVRVVTVSGDKLEKTIPNSVVKYYQSGEDFLRYLLTENFYPFQTSSYMFRKEAVIDECNEIPDFIKIAPVGDVFFMMLLATKGDVCYINKEMSCYRRFTEFSWSWTHKRDKAQRLRYEERVCKALEFFDIYTHYNYTEFVQKQLNQSRFKFLALQEKYCELMKPQYLEYFKQLPIKEKIYITCSVKMPLLIRLYKKLKRR